MTQRVVMLVDMNAFYASVHQALDPSLRGKPVIVAGDPAQRRGIILAKSYECKQYGKLTTGMPLWEALALIPQAVVVKAQMELYVKHSAQINQILHSFTPLVEPFSIDESFVDVTGCEKLFGKPLEIAKKIQDKILNVTGIPSSIGVAANKLCAKQAADFKKPLGISTLWPSEVREKLWPLPIRELFGIGSRLEKRMKILSIKTIGDLANADIKMLKERFGVVGLYLWRSANGYDDGSVNPHALNIAKSIGNQITLAKDYYGHEKISTAILDICELVGMRVRAGGYVGRTINLSLRDKDLVFYNWSRSLLQPTDLTEEIYTGAVKLMSEVWPEWRPVRLVGVSLSNLALKSAVQLEFFSKREQLSRLNATVDHLRERFGKNCIVRGRSLLPEGIYLER
jgi:DNA polymerase-4